MLDVKFLENWIIEALKTTSFVFLKRFLQSKLTEFFSLHFSFLNRHPFNPKIRKKTVKSKFFYFHDLFGSFHF